MAFGVFYGRKPHDFFRKRLGSRPQRWDGGTPDRVALDPADRFTHFRVRDLDRGTGNDCAGLIGARTRDLVGRWLGAEVKHLRSPLPQRALAWALRRVRQLACNRAPWRLFSGGPRCAGDSASRRRPRPRRRSPRPNAACGTPTRPACARSRRSPSSSRCAAPCGEARLPALNWNAPARMRPCTGRSKRALRPCPRCLSSRAVACLLTPCYVALVGDTPHAISQMAASARESSDSMSCLLNAHRSRHTGHRAHSTDSLPNRQTRFLRIRRKSQGLRCCQRSLWACSLHEVQVDVARWARWRPSTRVLISRRRSPPWPSALDQWPAS